MNRNRIKQAVLLLDMLWIALSLGASYFLRYASLQPSPSGFYGTLAAIQLATWIVLFKIMKLGGFDANWRMTTLARRIALATLLLMACGLSIAYLDRLYYSRLMLGYFTALLFAGFMGVRIGVFRFLRNNHQGLASNVVLVGNNRIAREFALKISRRPELLYRVAGVLHPGNGDGLGATSDQTLSSLGALDILRQNRVDELIVLEHIPGVEFQNFVRRCRGEGIRVKVLPHGYELYTSKPALAEIDGLPLITLQAPDPFPYAASVKRAMDITLALLLAAPAMLIASFAAVVLLRTKGTAIRREVRIGEGGRAFSMYRLNIDRDSNDGTPFERWLRDLSISELPQLWNVLSGEMSLVGPRPEAPDRVRQYSEWQRERLKAVPGITGLAQVNGLREQHTSEEKTRFDLQYLLEWSPLLDFSLLLQTAGTLARRCCRRPPEAIKFPADRPAGGLNAQRDSLSQVAHADRA